MTLKEPKRTSRAHTEYARGRTRCPRCGSHLPAPESIRSDGGCRNCADAP